MKFAVGVMLSSFGMFWGAEGAGANWPGGDAALIAIVPGVLIVAVAMARTISRTVQPMPLEQAQRTAAEPPTRRAEPPTRRAEPPPRRR